MWKIFDVVDVRSECVKSDVATFVMKKRSDFLLIEFEDDMSLSIKREVNFHLRKYEDVMSWLVVWVMKW